MIHVGASVWIKKAKVFVIEALDLENLNLDSSFVILCLSPSISRLPILTSIKLDRKKSEPLNTFHFVQFGTMIATVVLEILRIFVSTLIAPLPIPSNRSLSSAQR